MVIDHPLYRNNVGTNMHFYFGTFTQKDVAIYINDNGCVGEVCLCQIYIRLPHITNEEFYAVAFCAIYFSEIGT